MLSIIATEKEDGWDLQLPTAMLAYRTSIHETTKATPFSLMFGREARLSVDVVYGSPPDETYESPSEFALKLRDRLADAYKLVRNNTDVEQKRQKLLLYDRRTQVSPYTVGDQVWLHSPAVRRGKSRKLHRPWQGPYEIIKVLSDVIYRIRSANNKRKRLVVHSDRLKHYKGRSEKEQSTPPLSHYSSLLSSKESNVQPASSAEDLPSASDANPPTPPQQPQLRRSTRNRRPLDHIAGNFRGRKLSRIRRKGAFRGENFRGMLKLIA